MQIESVEAQEVIGLADDGTRAEIRCVANVAATSHFIAVPPTVSISFGRKSGSTRQYWRLKSASLQTRSATMDGAGPAQLEVEQESDDASR